MKRRDFLKNATLAGTSVVLTQQVVSCKPTQLVQANDFESKHQPPIAICTWNFGKATAKAMAVLQDGGNALDAVEQGVRVEEANPENTTVGFGGRPDREGQVSLDACVMDHKGNCGAVVYLQNIVHAVSVARKVMENTPHVMLAGKGAEQFAVESGFNQQNLLTPESKKAWEEWKIESNYQPQINIENHDTIGMLAMDKYGNISGACTTSGLAYKMAGRVGDSPIIGSGLFVDNTIGACVATGMGEEVVKTVGSFLVVELMRQGMTPQQACEEAIQRIVNKPNSNYKNFQVGYIALNKQGQTGAFSIHEGFYMMKATSNKNQSYASPFFYTPPVEK